MKKILFILCVMALAGQGIYASEIEEDYIDIAGDYCIEGDYNSAMQYLDRILELNPANNQVAGLKKGLTHIIVNSKDSFVSSASPNIKASSEFQKSGDENSRLNALLTATKDRNAYLAYYYLGNFYREHGDYQKALDAYNSSVSERSDFAPAYLTLGIILYEMGKYSAAINPIDKYLTFNPEDDLAYAVKARAEFSLGLFDQSRDDNLKAIQINDSPEYRFDEAKILYMDGEYEKSKKLFQSLLKDIQTEKIYEYMGLCDYSLKNYNEALLNFDKAIILSEDDEFLQSKYNEIKNILENKYGEDNV